MEKDELRFERDRAIFAKELEFGNHFLLAGVMYTATQVTVSANTVALEFVPARRLFGRMSSMLIDPEMRMYIHKVKTRENSQ